jgi:excisionase family DNA binding protein
VESTSAQHTAASHVLDLEGIMARLEISQSTAKRLLAAKRIPGFKVGRQWRVSKAVFNAWLVSKSS